VKDQLLLLLELQTIDLKVRELDTARKALPARAAPLRNDLAKLEAMLDGEKQKLTDAERGSASGSDLSREQELLRAAKSKLQGTRTGKEFHAATREVEFKRKSINDREGELKKVTEALGSSGAVIGEARRRDQKLRDELAAEEARIATSSRSGPAGRGSPRAATRSAKIDKAWLKTYDALIVRGVAVAPVSPASAGLPVRSCAAEQQAGAARDHRGVRALRPHHLPQGDDRAAARRRRAARRRCADRVARRGQAPTGASWP
jgi:predicted  nucleic acid-binding Zn-ribbon protein